MFRTALDFSGLTKKFAAISGDLNGALSRALNYSGFDMRAAWAKEAASVFDRPTSFTTRAPLFKPSTPQKLVVEVFIRDDASGGTPPVKYLAPQVTGGPRTQKRFEWALHRHTRGAAKFYVPGRGMAAQMNAQGNLPASIIKKVMSQLGAAESVAGFSANETATTRKRRLRRQRKKGGGGSFFILRERRGKLPAGTILERIETGFGSGVRTVLFPSNAAPRYRKRYDVFTLTHSIYGRIFAEKLKREMRRMPLKFS